MSASVKPDQSFSNKWNHPVIDLTLLTLVWLTCLLIINPAGNFPLNDDWSYGLTVKHLLTTGDYRPTGWENIPLITNVLWGSLFCLPSGFSFTALRLSTLAASWLGILGVYWLLKELRQPRPVRILAVLMLAANPIYCTLSYTFMTDVPYITLTIFAAVFFVKNLKSDTTSSLFLGTAFSLAAILSRQVGLAVPLAFAIVCLWQRGLRARAILRGIAPLILCVITLIVFEHWLKVTGRLPALYNLKNDQLFQALSKPVKLGGVFAHSVYISLMYLGLFLSPLLFFNFSKPGWLPKNKWSSLIFFATALAALTVVNKLCGKGLTMPLSGNLINQSGMGPLTLRDTYFLGDTLPALPGYLWQAITVISLIGAAILLSRITVMATSLRLKSFKPEPDEAHGIFLLLIPVIYLFPFLTIGLFDRYLIPTLPFFAAGLLLDKPQTQPVSFKPCHLLAGFLLAGFFISSIAATKDYLAWNRTRWMALNDLMENNAVKPTDIDGGFEFNGYYRYDPAYKVAAGKSDWWVNDDLYLITFNPVPSYTVQHEYHYVHWLPSYTGSIFVLKRNL